MANFLELVAGGPDTVRGLGALLRVGGEDLGAKASEILSRIQEIEAVAPWGTDDYGKNITNFYTRDMDGSPANEVMKGWFTENGPALVKLGDALVAAMTDFQSTELENWLSIANSGGASLSSPS